MRQKEAQNSHLERQLDNKCSEQSSIADQLKTIQGDLKNRTDHISQLEAAMKGKETEIQGTTTLVEKVKTLHSEQCQELQAQIEQVAKARA